MDGGCVNESIINPPLNCWIITTAFGTGFYAIPFGKKEVQVKGFNDLELFFKKDFIKENARFLISANHLHFIVNLYSWDRFLFEQYFDREKNCITMVTLAGKIDLDKYLKEISLADLALVIPL